MLSRGAPADSDPIDADAPLRDDERTAAAIGEMLFSVADLARRLKIDPEWLAARPGAPLRDAIVARGERADAAD